MKDFRHLKSPDYNQDSSRGGLLIIAVLLLIAFSESIVGLIV